jgi:hypothetical protein
MYERVTAPSESKWKEAKLDNAMERISMEENNT